MLGVLIALCVVAALGLFIYVAIKADAADARRSQRQYDEWARPSPETPWDGAWIYQALRRWDQGGKP